MKLSTFEKTKLCDSKPSGGWGGHSNAGRLFCENKKRTGRVPSRSGEFLSSSGVGRLVEFV
jgi:hypothetical protein